MNLKEGHLWIIAAKRKKATRNSNLFIQVPKMFPTRPENKNIWRHSSQGEAHQISNSKKILKKRKAISLLVEKLAMTAQTKVSFRTTNITALINRNLTTRYPFHNFLRSTNFSPT